MPACLSHTCMYAPARFRWFCVLIKRRFSRAGGAALPPAAAGPGAGHSGGRMPGALRILSGSCVSSDVHRPKQGRSSGLAATHAPHTARPLAALSLSLSLWAHHRLAFRETRFVRCPAGVAMRRRPVDGEGRPRSWLFGELLRFGGLGLCVALRAVFDPRAASPGWALAERWAVL